jgi:hypothetical protein
MKAAILAALAVSVSGCQAMTGYPPPTMTRAEALKTVEADSSPNAEAAYATAPNEVARQAVRDRIVRARIYAIDVNYHEFTRSISTEQKAFAVGSDLAVLALAGAGTLAKSSHTQARLAAWSAGVLGGRSAIDKEIYFDKTLPVIIAQMEASRRTALVPLIGGLSQPDSDYPLLQAKVDLETYYMAGTLPGALNAITKEAGKQAAAADQKIENITEAKYAYTDAGKRIRAFWKPDGAVDPAHAKALNDWLAANAGGISIPEFFRGGGTAAQQGAVIEALKIP